MRWLLFPATALVLAVAYGLSGCSKATTSSKSEATPFVKEGDHDHVVAASQSEEDAKISAGLAELSATDKVLAEKQKICPVSGEALGLMGAPVKIDVKGQPVFICCAGCKEELLAKPDEFLAKLKK